MEFVVVDVETANADLSSICQIGMACFRDGLLSDTWVSLVDPEDEFDNINVSIHGIDEFQVRGAPKWRAIFPQIASRIRQKVVVSHTPFDRVALIRACDRAGAVMCDCSWLDSARVVRRAWPQFSKAGYGLANVAAHLGFEYAAHDALEDAKCAGQVLLRAISETGHALDEWLTRVQQPISPPHDLHRDGDPNGNLYGEVLVFTGSLSMCREAASNVASSAGCRVDTGVTKHTTLLVVGDQDLRKLNGNSKSGKQRKAEQLIAQGQAIRILGESDFKRVVASHATTGAKRQSLTEVTA